MFDIKINLDDANEIMKKHGVCPGGKAQMFFTSEIARASNPYTPFRGGVLQASMRIEKTGDAITYSTPYARYLWYGKLMVDPITGKGAFYNKRTGRFWSRPNTPKVLTDVDLNFRDSPPRGARWTERAWLDHKDEIIRATEIYLQGGVRR